ncbi:MAG: PAS-domain containing protein [Pelagimonas sp.]|jgi:signal transduction histidine kinase/CheY-like chemotaxis protein|nr:PAS-domain containing protein [Pelagimonas sp.]
MSLINPHDSLERQNEKLLKIAQALMTRVEYGQAQSGAPYAQFERSALLEQSVRERTVELEQTFALLQTANARLSEANQQTEKARRNLADAIETVSEGFALFDPEDRLVMCNSRFCRDMPDILSHLLPGLPFAKYVEHVSQSRFLSLSDGQSRQNWLYQRLAWHHEPHVLFNVRFLRDRWLQVSEHRTSDGGTVVVQTDVSDIMRLERAERQRLKDTQAQMVRATLDHLEQGVAIFDQDGHLVGWNAKIGELLSLPARRFFIGARFEGLSQLLDQSTRIIGPFDQKQLFAWAKEKTHRSTITWELEHNQQRNLQAFGASMPDRGFLISITDITAERRANRHLHELNTELERRVRERTSELEDALAAAERANTSKSRFVAAASHDLLQPLSAAKLYISSLQNRLEDPEQQKVLAKTGSALEGVSQIIDDLMDMSKLDGDGLQLNIGAFRLDDVLLPLVQEMEGLAAQNGLRLSYRGVDAQVQSDPTYLRRIVSNLLANAIRYTEQGRVFVGARRRGRYVRIEVWDTGPGIDHDDQLTIFDEFRRLPTHNRLGDGLGLGLSIVERACTRLSHPLQLCSRPDQGSCFQVSVPLAADQPAIDAARSHPGADLLENHIILLIDEDFHMRRAITVMLESWGIHVIEAENAAAAHSLIEDLGIPPDICLLDHRSGAEIFETTTYPALQQMLGTLPCALMSEIRPLTPLTPDRKTGFHWLRKPLDRQALFAFLAKACL